MHLGILLSTVEVERYFLIWWKHCWVPLEIGLVHSLSCRIGSAQACPPFKGISCWRVGKEDEVTNEVRVASRSLAVKFVLEHDFGVVWIFGVVGCSEVLEVVGCLNGLWLQL